MPIDYNLQGFSLESMLENFQKMMILDAIQEDNARLRSILTGKPSDVETNDD